MLTHQLLGDDESIFRHEVQKAAEKSLELLEKPELETDLGVSKHSKSMGVSEPTQVLKNTHLQGG